MTQQRHLVEQHVDDPSGLLFDVQLLPCRLVELAARHRAHRSGRPPSPHATAARHGPARRGWAAVAPAATARGRAGGARTPPRTRAPPVHRPQRPVLTHTRARRHPPPTSDARSGHPRDQRAQPALRDSGRARRSGGAADPSRPPGDLPARPRAAGHGETRTVPMSVRSRAGGRRRAPSTPARPQQSRGRPPRTAPARRARSQPPPPRPARGALATRANASATGPDPVHCRGHRPHLVDRRPRALRRERAHPGSAG